MNHTLRMSDLDLTGQRVLIREDLNVPIDDGRVSSDARIRAAVPSIQLALEKGAKVLVMSHLGRPKEGQTDDQYSLAPVAECLQALLQVPVHLVKDYLHGIQSKPDGIVLLENIRFNIGEKSNDQKLAKALAELCDVFVMDAFGTAHRAHASTYGVAQFATTACAGPLLVAELHALGQALHNPAKPMLAIVGGSKVSTKLTVLESLMKRVDQLIVGGGIANTFIAAAGHSVGESLFEPNLIPQAKTLMASGTIPLPTDVVVAKEFSSEAQAIIKNVDAVTDDEFILDIGPETSKVYSDIIANAATVVWNGPVGVFEFDQFGNGTKATALAIADSQGFSIAGGGDTLAAIDKYQIRERVSYISTGGGAFLEFLEGKKLPAVTMLESRFT